ncbi:MAG: RNA polymerase sigma factor [Fibrobacteres bacterium]|jgi:RNA polymerase sigma-70 factor (ECF subfamily)|nr:RNA polymerase sigma factor [Fibrobacterota bacterium]
MTTLDVLHASSESVNKSQTDKDQLLNELFRKYQRKVTYVCYGYMKDWDDAREMAQEAFIRAYRGLDSFEGRSHLMTWITRIAINQCLSRLAARGREKLGLLNFLSDRENEEAEDRWEEPCSRVAVGRLIEFADPVTRKVLGLVMHQGLTHSQIATTLGVSRVAVTRRLTRFKRKVQGKVGCLV